MLQPRSHRAGFRNSYRCREVQADLLLYAAAGNVDRARLIASRAPGSGDWLDALPLSSIGLKMVNATVRIAADLRLSAQIDHTNEYAEVWSQSMDIMDNPVATAQDGIHVTIK